MAGERERKASPMQTYKAPLRDMRFVLHELHDSAALSHLRGLEDVSPDLLDHILEEAAKVAELCCCRSTRPAMKRAACWKTVSSARPKASRRPTTRFAKVVGPRCPPIRVTAAKACRKASTSWSKK